MIFMPESNIRNLKKNIYVLFAAGGLAVIFSESFYLFADPYSDLGWWVAAVLHTLGGAYAFFFSRAVWQYAKTIYKIEIPHAVEIIIWVGGALVLGVFWEWYEFVIDRFMVLALRKDSLMTYADNIGDLLLDFGGALLAGIYFWENKSR